MKTFYLTLLKNILFIFILTNFTISLEAKNPLLVNFNQPVMFSLVTSSDIKLATDDVIQKAEKIKNNIISLTEPRTFNNTLKKLDDLYAEVEIVWSASYLLANVSTDEAIRAEGLITAERVSNYFNQLQLNEALFNSVHDYAKSEEANQLMGYQKKYLDETILSFRRSGFGQSKEIRDQIKDVQSEITALSLQFNKNIAEVDDFLIFSEKELSGLPDNYKKVRIMDNGQYKVDVTYPSYIPFMTLADSDEARKKLFKVFKNRAYPKNISVLDNLIKKRVELVKLLGYSSYAEYITEIRMTKNPKTVWAFEKKLQKKVNKKAKKDVALMAGIKSKRLGREVAVIEAWEADYYENLVKKEFFQLDSEELKQYFEFNNVTAGLFEIYQELFGIHFQEVVNPSIWHEDVLMYEVFDKQTKQLIGQFYLDMFPRKNKYSHTAAFSIIMGKQFEQGYQKPTYALVCNFPKPTLEQPSLLSHREVETYFHEFGHLLHGILTTSKLIGFSGTSVKRDFVEAPSQMLENWAWKKESLALFAKHYKTGAIIPDELVEKMIAAKNVNSGTKNLQQIYYGTLDFTFHDGFIPTEKETTTTIVKDLQNSITLYPYVEGTHFQASFGHLVGYAASYYGYKWSEVYAADMFSVFESEGMLNAEVGARYRKTILEPGGTKDPLILVSDFLGRKPNNKAFIDNLGL